MVEGTVVEGTVVDGTTVVDGNIVLDGETLGAGPTTLLPPLALSSAGVEPTLLPSWLGGVPVMLGAGVAAYGVVVAAPGAAAPAAPTWANAGSAASVATKIKGKRRASNKGNLLCNRAE